MRITMLAALVGNPFGQERVLALSAGALRAAGHEIEVLTDHALGAVPGTSRVVPIEGMSSLQPFSDRARVASIEDQVKAALARFTPDIIHFIDFLDERILHLAKSFAPCFLTAHTVAPTCPASTRQSSRDAFCTRHSGYGCLVGHYRHGCLSFLKSDAHRAHAIYGFQKRKAAYRKELSAIFAISPFVQSQLVQDGWDASAVRLIPNPVETARGAGTSIKSENVILLCSRLTRLKGVDTVLKAAAQMKAVDFQLRVAGEGSEKRALIGMAAELGLQQKVVWLGQQTPAQVAAEMEKAAIYVQANRGPEAFGMALAEAMTWSCACIVSDMPALTDLVQNGETGLVFGKESSEELAEKMKLLLAERQLREKLGNAAKQFIAKGFSVDAHLQATLQQYARVLQPNAATSSSRHQAAPSL